MSGISQSTLAAAIGVTFQQVQKYERGANRIGASRLHRLAAVLRVPIGHFFEDDAAEHRRVEAPTPAEDDSSGSVLARRETLELVRAYYRIGDPKVRKQVRALVGALAAGPQA